MPKEPLLQITPRCRYALMVMMLVARAAGRPVTTIEASAELGLSLSYLEQLFAILRRKELVVSSRGPGGGYRLAKEAYELSVAEIIQGVQAAPKDSEQPLSTELTTLWALFCQQTYWFFSTLTLGQLAGLPMPVGEKATLPRL